FARRAGNINPSRDTALAVLGPLHDACILAALGAGGGFAGVHDLFPVSCFCDLRHTFLLTGMCRQPARGRGSTWCLGSNSEAGVQTDSEGRTRKSVRQYSPFPVYMRPDVVVLLPVGRRLANA